MTPVTLDASALLELVRRRSPNAVRLAEVVSLATRIEPELLRQARLKLLPDVDAGAEADLWFSPLVQSSTPLALVLLPGVSNQLRRQLAQSKESLNRSWEVLEEAHRNAPAAIKVEEKVTWQALSGGLVAQEAFKKELRSVVSAIVTQNRTGLARWALRALPRFPKEVRETKEAKTLLWTAAAHLNAWQLIDEQIESQNLPAGFLSELSVVLPPDLPQIPVGVRLLRDTGEFGVLTQSASAQRYTVEFSNPPSTDQPESIMTLPGTNPLLLEVSWGEESQQQVKHLSLYQGRTEVIEVGAGEVRIRTASGDIYTLHQDAQQKAEPVPESRAPALVRIPAPPRFGYVPRHDADGRDIVEQLSEELAPERGHLVGLWGAGGVGKSVVAAETARGLLSAFKQRVVWLSAEGRSDFNVSAMLNEIAVQLDRPDLRTLAALNKVSQVTKVIRSAPTLIVVDQFETIQPNNQTLCLRLLKNAKCPVLLVTRQKIRTAFNVALGAMSQPEAFEFLERLISQIHIPLSFIGLNRSDLLKVAEGNPLVMQWVVAQIDLTRNPGEVLKRVAQGEGDAVARVFERSFNLPELGDDGRTALLALSLFVPSASKEALAEVANFGDNRERFEEVTQRMATLQLVNVQIGGGRLWVEGLVRQLLNERLKRDKREREIRGRFVACFLAYAEAHRKPTPENYDALDAEYDNLLDAMDIAAELKDWESVIRLCMSTGQFLELRGYWDEALRRNQQARRAARLTKQDEMIPPLAETAGAIFLRRREFDKAEKDYRFVLDSYMKVKNEAGVAGALRNLGSIALERRNPAEAEKLYSDSLQIAYKIQDRAGVADNLHNLAIVAQVQGDLAKARQFYQESLSISQSVGDQRSIAISFHQLGVISQQLAEFEQAYLFYNQSLDIKRRLGDQNGIADTSHQLGLLLREMGDTTRSGQRLQEALAIFEQLGSPSANEVRQDLEALQAGVLPTKSQESTAGKSSAKKKAAPASSRKKAPSGAVKRGAAKESYGGSFRGGSSKSGFKGGGSKGGAKGGYGSGSSRAKK